VRFCFYVLLCGVLIVPFSPLTVAQEDRRIQQAPVPSSNMSVSLRNGRLTARVERRPLAAVLEEIALRTHVAITLADGIGEDLLSAAVSDVPLDEALRRLLHEYDAFLYYGAVGTHPSRLRAVWVYAKGTAVALRPVPPEVWAGTGELEASLTDANPHVRERAYQVLMDRPSDRSRELTLSAIRGASEQDEGIRQRLLSNAVTKGMALPPDLLSDLARADGSEQIRLMALDALAMTAPSVTAKEVAEAALYDPSGPVRERAADILSQLGRPR